MGVDWGRDEREYEYDDSEPPGGHRRRRRSADWDHSDWVPDDEPMGPEADWNPRPERPPYEDERYHREHSDRARSNLYRHPPMSEDEIEKRLFEEARWETARQPRRAPPPQRRGYRGSGGKWEDDVYDRHRPPERNMAADEFYRMQEQEWYEKRREDPYRRRRKPVAKAPKWYRTDAEKSRMARRHAHEPFVEKERIVLDPYKLPAGIVAIAILWIIAGIVGLVLLAIALIDIARLTSQGGVEVHTEYLFLGVIIDLVFSIAYIHAGRSLLLRRRFGYSFTMFAVWILLAISVILVGIVTAGSAITGLWVLLCAGICLLPVILIAVYVIIYMRQYDSMFK